jgi:hypothetical protein
LFAVAIIARATAAFTTEGVAINNHWRDGASSIGYLI